MSFVEKYFFGTPKMPRNLDISTFLEEGDINVQIGKNVEIARPRVVSFR